ncbi:hypothetical protein FACS1894186_2940 [Alphaproteobacteria bacterium]|nr:hypothetical protein FACS1894186_2940 [Alphaproteobacteria bacterium]
MTGRLVRVRVVPKAAADSAEALPDGSWRVRVRAAPEDGKANAAVLRVLALALGVPKSRLSVKRGQASRDKLVEVA